MPFVTIPANTWTAVVTTTEDTAIQNRGGRTVYVTTVATGGLGISEGIALGPDQAIAVVSGKSVSVASPSVEGQIFYVGV